MMKRKLLTIITLSCMLGIANAQNATYTDYSLELKWNKTESKHDTVKLKESKSTMNPVDSAVYEIYQKEWDYVKGGKFDQKSYLKIKSIDGIKVYSDINLKFDTVVSAGPNPNGSLEWKESSWSYTSFANSKAEKTVSYYDLSAYNLGIIKFIEASYYYPSPGVVIQASTSLFPSPQKGDSIINYRFNGRDTLTVKYKYDKNTMAYILSNKTAWKYDNLNRQILQEDYSYDTQTSSFMPSGKTEKSYGSNNSFVAYKNYQYNNSAWQLSSLDTSYQDANGMKTVEVKYSVVNGIPEYTGKTITLNSFSFVESTPVPAAPSNLMVLNTLLRTEQALAVSYTLTWKDNSYNEQKFEIYRREISTSTGTKIGEVGANVTTYTDNSASDTQEYEYYVVAVNGSFSSVFSNTVGVNPTGIEDALIGAKFSVYPNPTTDNWNFSNKDNVNKISVYSIEGQILIETLNPQYIEASNFDNGAYLMKVYFNDNTTKSIKVLKK
jgi:hypothetical protein